MHLLAMLLVGAAMVLMASASVMAAHVDAIGSDLSSCKAAKAGHARRGPRPAQHPLGEHSAWHVPSNPFDATHKVTLRGLLSMTGSVGVSGASWVTRWVGRARS